MDMTGRPALRKNQPKSQRAGMDAKLDEHVLALLQPKARSVRLNGKSTCIRLERVYWNILEEMARSRGMPINAWLAELDLEVQLRYGRVSNFSSLVRLMAVLFTARSMPGRWTRAERAAKSLLG